MPTLALKTAANSKDLASILQTVFGFGCFRANQLEVCEAAVDGRDLLLVMPTGAGKSLCYQLPAIARGGTALVISPLIALMDDQAAKLSAAGLRVARIHSGLSRDAAPRGGPPPPRRLPSVPLHRTGAPPRPRFFADACPPQARAGRRRRSPLHLRMGSRF